MQKKIRIVLAEDDVYSRDLVKSILAKYPDIDVVGEAENGVKLVKLAELLQPDALMVDVEMPELTGVDAVREIAERNLFPVVVFVTGHPDYAVEAFELSSCDYVLKPYKEDRIDAAVEKIRREIERRDKENSEMSTFTRLFNKVRIKSHGELRFINMDDILFVATENRRAAIHCTDGREFIVGRSLTEVQKQLDPNMFFRSHNSYIINMKMVEKISPWDTGVYAVNFTNSKKEAFIARGKVKDLMNIFDFMDDVMENEEGIFRK